MIRTYKAYLLSLLAGSLLLFIPLLRDLHFESAMLAAVIGCCWGAWKSSGSDSGYLFHGARISAYLFTAAIPLTIFALIKGCLSFDGFAFWVFTPVPSVFFGIAIGRMFKKMQIPAPRWLTFILLGIFGIGIFFWQLFSFPQVFFYNHVWGHWPGPIYDESVRISLTYILFRFMTLLWILLFWYLPDWSESLMKKWVFFLSLAAVLFTYLNYTELGYIVPEERIQDQLGTHYATEHFDIWYDPRFYSPNDIRYQALRHEFYFERISDTLDLTWPEGRRIHSYLYPHAWAKKNMVGAKFTSYVPIWLDQDQLHIAKQQLDDVLQHEMVHVLSKQFGNRLFNGSYSIGLIEGLAEAIAGDASPRSTLDQLVAAQDSYPDVSEIRSALSPFGFYSSAGSISYTTMGSFTSYLLRNYPVNTLKEAYPSCDPESTFGVPLDTLVNGWQAHLAQTSIDSTDRSVSELLFSQRSLFQKDCPHTVPVTLQTWDRFRYHMAEEDTQKAVRTLEQLHELSPENALVSREWASFKLRADSATLVSEELSRGSENLHLRVLYADALFVKGERELAVQWLNSIKEEILSSRDRAFRFTLEMREDNDNWEQHLKRRYSDILPDSSVFIKLSLPNQILSLQKAMDLGNYEKAILYGDMLLKQEISAYWFGTLQYYTDRLIFRNEKERARSWILKLRDLPLRDRYRERLQLSEEWFIFLHGEFP